MRGKTVKIISYETFDFQDRNMQGQIIMYLRKYILLILYATQNY